MSCNITQQLKKEADILISTHENLSKYTPAANSF